MPRPQFTLRALLVLMLAIACFFGGNFAGRRRYEIEHNGDLQDLRIRRAYLAKVEQWIDKKRMQLEDERNLAESRKYRLGGNGSWVEFAGVRVEALDGRKVKLHDPAPTDDN